MLHHSPLHKIKDTNISTTNYSNTLIGWSNQSLPYNVDSNLTNVKYNKSASSAREYIINNFKWKITDGRLNLLL